MPENVVVVLKLIPPLSFEFCSSVHDYMLYSDKIPVVERGNLGLSLVV